MNNNLGAGSGGNAAGNQSSFINRRESREFHDTRPHAAIGNGVNGNVGMNRSYSSGSFDFENMIASLHDLFEQDRQIASQGDSTRCGICYLYYKISELTYREDGYYICNGCEQTLGNQSLPMLRKQQK